MTAAECDARRGVMWEAKWRGTLEEWAAAVRPEDDAGRIKALLEAARVPTTPAPPVPDWPAARVGWGTYRYRYDPALVRAAVEAGCPMIDTAEGYGYGRAEAALGEALRAGKGTTWLASKVARNHHSKWAVYKAGLRSRGRLGHPIDLYQVHWPPPDGDWGAIMDGMVILREQEVIRHVGVCNCCVGQLAEARRAARARGFDVVSNQIRLNEADRGALDALIPYCERAGVRVNVYSPLSQGALGKRAAAALDWVLVWGGVSIVIPATNDVRHLRSNLRAGGLEVPPALPGPVGAPAGGA